jgi:sugar phosphate isomerase/epimerase
MRLAGGVQLTYCTNIHAANGWSEVLGNLERFGPSLKARLSPGAPFGLGLRLSGEESRELLEGDRMARFRAFLESSGLYVFTMNGFPYGHFHGAPVKANVHAPDWRERERVEYTLRLAEILAALLPEDSDGGISTSPLSYRAWVREPDKATWQAVTRHIVEVAGALVRLSERHGKLIHLDIEPEPDGLLEDGDGVLRFYQDWLLPVGARLLADTLGVPRAEAEVLLLEHVQICFDTCHAAVVHEDPAEVLDRFAEAGIRVGKVQVSSALKVAFEEDGDGRERLAEALRPFVEATYLHQVVQRNRDGSLRRYPDLPQALEHVRDPCASEWRVHFHVPVSLDRFGELGSTQDTILRTFERFRERPFTRHLEIETYTWEVLPSELKVDLLESIGREYEWVRDVF